MPWTKTEVYAADTGAFCSGLNSARTSNSLTAFSSCSQSSTLMNHAKTMAEADSVWHSSSDSIVGASSSISSLMSAFMASSGHKAQILGGYSPGVATVGCYWRKDTGQTAADLPAYEFKSVFCAARFTN